MDPRRIARLITEDPDRGMRAEPGGEVTFSFDVENVNIPQFRRYGDNFHYKVRVKADFEKGDPGDMYEPDSGPFYLGADILDVLELNKITPEGEYIEMPLNPQAIEAVSNHFSQSVEDDDDFVEFAFDTLARSGPGKWPHQEPY